MKSRLASLLRPSWFPEIVIIRSNRIRNQVRLLAFGYSAIQDALMQDANVGASILLMIALGKIVTTGLTIGSGGSGGVFGPSMVIGG